MGKKSKKAGVSGISNGAAIAIGLVVGVVLIKALERKVDQFFAGLKYKFSDVKLKLTNGVNLTATGSLTVTNTNSFNVSVDSFNGELKYGKYGPAIFPIKITQGFQLPAGGSGSTAFSSQVSILTLAGNLLAVVTSIIGGQFKKGWLTGTLNTSLLPIPVDTEIGLLSE